MGETKRLCKNNSNPISSRKAPFFTSMSKIIDIGHKALPFSEKPQILWLNPVLGSLKACLYSFFG
jgi:hypothetical protein